MKAIMISIKPEWVRKILNGEKTIEIRKTIPKCKLPCKVYIYCTKGKKLYKCVSNFDEDLLNGKVIAEFTLNKVSTYDWDTDFLNTKQNMYYTKSGEADKTCLTYEKLCDYGKGKDLYGWHIDDLKIYDKPKELSEFRKRNKCHYSDYDEGCCFECCTFYDLGDCDGGYSELERPPQSWCYVE